MRTRAGIPQSEKHKQWVRDNRAKVNGYALAWYHRNRTAARESAKLYRRKFKEENPAIAAVWAQQRRDYRAKARAECFLAYGNQCACCGERQREFLSIDHVNGGGTQARKQGFPAGARLYIKLRELGYPPDFRLLCHNCNQAMGFHGYCPHQSVRRDHAVTLSDFDLQEVIGL